jgi:hypothetical protein
MVWGPPESISKAMEYRLMVQLADETAQKKREVEERDSTSKGTQYL